MTDTKKNPLHTHDCPSCGAPCGSGFTAQGNKKVYLDLRAKCYAWVGSRNPTEIVLTEMAAVDHDAACPYRDVD